MMRTENDQLTYDLEKVRADEARGDSCCGHGDGKYKCAAPLGGGEGSDMVALSLLPA